MQTLYKQPTRPTGPLHHVPLKSSCIELAAQPACALVCMGLIWFKKWLEEQLARLVVSTYIEAECCRQSIHYMLRTESICMYPSLSHGYCIPRIEVS